MSVAVTPFRLPHVSGYVFTDRMLPPLSAYLYPHPRKRSTVSLRLGHATALTVHRTVIHYRVDTALPLNHSRGGFGEFLCFYSLSCLRASSPGGGAHT